MAPLRVAIVGRDPALRALAAETFDQAPPGWEVTLQDASATDADVTIDLSGDLAGARVVPFDAEAPERVLDAVARISAGDEGPVGIWSPCPGSGVTTVAVHLSAWFGSRGACTLVDLDPRRGAGVRLGCPPVDDDVTDPALRARPVLGGCRLLEGTMPDRDGGRVIVDGPAEAVRDVGCAKHVIVLPSGRSGVERSLHELERIPERSALVINRTGWGGELTRASIARLVGHRIALELPFSPGLRDAEDRRELLTSPLSPWLHRIRRLARAL